MNEAEQDAKLLEMARQRGWNKPLCPHEHKTLCQWPSKNGWFAAYQCDDCGQMLRDDVTLEQIEQGADLPMFDRQDYINALKKANGPQNETTMGFFGKALRR